jgi:hypothetical protein
MAAGVITADGNLLALEVLIRAGLLLRLYTNGKTPAAGDLAADYAELKVRGYAAVPLDARLETWSLQAGIPASATYREELEIRFEDFGPTVRGYYLTLGDRLYGVQPLDSPFPIENRGDVIAIRPALFMGRRA